MCPDAEPFCDDEYDDCVSDCDFGNSDCIAACEEGLEECFLGEVWSTNTVRYLDSYATVSSAQRCGYYPWYQIHDPEIWHGFEATFVSRTTTTVHCRPTEETFELVSEISEDEHCWIESSAECVRGSYMGGRCRWSVPGG